MQYKKTIFILAGEVSGDQLGGILFKASFLILRIMKGRIIL